MNEPQYPLTSFEQYLESCAIDEGAMDGLSKDLYEENFDAWLETQDVNSIVEYGQNYAKELIKYYNK